MKRILVIAVMVMAILGASAPKSQASDAGAVILGVFGINALTTIITGRPMIAPMVVSNGDYYERPVPPVYYAPPVVYYQPRMVYYNHRPCNVRHQDRPYRGGRLVPKPHGRY